MILPDVNVLIYAFHAGSRDQPRYRSWLQGMVSGHAAYGISTQVLASVVRICTHPRIFADPVEPRIVVDFCRALIAPRHCNLITPGVRHWDIFEHLCTQSGAKGNLVQDAWFAALAIESGCKWITSDRDYARFEGLDWGTPF